MPDEVDVECRHESQFTLFYELKKLKVADDGTRLYALGLV